ncbi:MAG: hypothetical protein K2K17_02510, partial [Lachnospiraceae bacterium]|nr:hypothetical protein [Lachnospiraceae bacterium]
KVRRLRKGVVISMSYCVNCGVELETSIKKCPLCNTIVINPNELQPDMTVGNGDLPFPNKIGVVEPIKRKDLAVVLTGILACTAVSCLLLNYLMWKSNQWSLLVLGFCVLLWVMVVPPLMIRNMRRRIMMLLNGAAVCIYIALIGIFTDSSEWVVDLGIPITLTVLVLVELFLTVATYKRSFAVLACLFFMEAAVLCISIELLVNHALHHPLEIKWSAIVLTVCTIITVALATMFSRRRVRNEIKRRFHL